MLNIDTLTVEVIKPKRNFISKLWVNKTMESSIMIQYSIMPLNVTQSVESKLKNLIVEEEDDFVIDDDTAETFLMLRQFANLKDFLLKVG